MTETIVYTPLQSDRHIRLLQVVNEDNDDDVQTFTYRIIQLKLPEDHNHSNLEAISYTWGSSERVSTLPIEGQTGGIGLTKNLTEALPYLSRHSATKLLWIDQICINQNDNVEKGKQVALMSEIYKAAQRVIVWLGVDPENSLIVKQWLEEVEKMIDGMPNAHKMKRDSPDYNSDIRHLVVRSTFISDTTDPMYLPVIRKFWTPPWFTRGWIVQEFILARKTLILSGNFTFSMQDLEDLAAVPAIPTPGDHHNYSNSYRVLLNMKLHNFKDAQPLRFFRTIAFSAQEFATTELCDSLYAFLGMIPELSFAPNYAQSIRENFTRFAVEIAKQFGSIDFLSLWASNLDPLVPNTPKEFLGFASWAPSWSFVPLSAPWRLAAGGVRSIGEAIAWNAAGGRKHVHDQEDDAETTGRLVVKGKIVDYVNCLTSARFDRYYDNIDDEYLNGLVGQVKEDIPGLDEDWDLKEMIEWLHGVSHNGHPPRETYEVIMGIENPMFSEVRDMDGFNTSLGLCLSMGRGRRFMRTEGGRLGLAPFIGSRGKSEEGNGSAIVVLHGCIVPAVLEQVSEEPNEWKVVGDCYVEGLMFGEGVDWDEGDARSFVLV